MKKLSFGLTIVVPCLNEEKYIKKTINNILIGLKKTKLNYEIFVVDDGSTDTTYKIAKKIEKKNSLVRVFKNSKNLGMGKTLKNCSLKSQYKYILLVPGDNSFTMKSIYNLGNAVGKNEFIIGQRVNYFKIVSFFRKITFLSMKVLAFFLTGKLLKEVNGSAIYPTKIISNYNLTSNRYNFSIDLLNLMFLNKLNYTYVNVFISKSTIYNTNAATFKNIFSILTTFIKLLYFNLKIKSGFSKFRKFSQKI